MQIFPKACSSKANPYWLRDSERWQCSPKAFPKAASTYIKGFPKAARSDNFMPKINKFSGSFQEPVYLLAAFGKSFMTVLVASGKISRNWKFSHRSS